MKHPLRMVEFCCSMLRSAEARWHGMGRFHAGAGTWPGDLQRELRIHRINLVIQTTEFVGFQGVWFDIN